jgi:hypothetical protein
MMKRLSLTFLFLFFIARATYAQEPHVYFGNLHSHTSYSDGVGTPEEAYEHARDTAGLDFLAITDHNHSYDMASDPTVYSGNQEASTISTANRMTQDGVFVAIYGQEFSSIGSGNHANILECGEVIDTEDVANGKWDVLLNDWLISHLDSQGKPAIVLLNHPATSGSPNSKEYGRDDFNNDFEEWRDTLDSFAQLINIVNGPSHQGTTPGQPSESEFLRYLNYGLHVAPTADQDNHRADWGSVADTRTAVITTSLTKPDLLNALRERHVYATQDKNLKVIAKVNSELMGTRFLGEHVPNDGDTLNIEITIMDDNEPNAEYDIDVYSDKIGGIERADVISQHLAEGNGTHTISGIEYTGGNQYIFFKLTQRSVDEDFVDLAWTAPVWFEPNTQTDIPTGTALAMEVNLITEKAKITNIGNSDINLKDYTLVSVKGNQRYLFENDLILAPGASVTVTSGPNALDQPPAFLRWSTSRKWNNDGDPAELLDQNNDLVVRAD